MLTRSTRRERVFRRIDASTRFLDYRLHTRAQIAGNWKVASDASMRRNISPDPAPELWATATRGSIYIVVRRRPTHITQGRESKSFEGDQPYRPSPSTEPVCPPVRPEIK